MSSLNEVLKRYLQCQYPKANFMDSTDVLNGLWMTRLIRYPHGMPDTMRVRNYISLRVAVAAGRCFVWDTRRTGTKHAGYIADPCLCDNIKGCIESLCDLEKSRFADIGCDIEYD